ncbi:Cytochrome c oxidase copper metallochaperone [Komagataella phaffii CBS 7435]|uniref:Cytochrome c oxidase assembly protein/Cu2+ chaperone n=2 Tax=Komagataella phaffii TaxID=460519 RepID=C4R5F9_KOMPG|nr:Cytochrome c oxidase assembly protein/Cu2+ chaperone [Komagataella phaffii GS115]CAH2449421.1 Cytochrome c oxidase copper metallochaperone [Komagataella phaffii CBS 7435]CAY70795.1 Cytochrome c oxidase assembly protein/Cu2+ chaperone [Komagataella phaffii GS115]SCV12201.1 Cytochrome c oxidase copper metallochaperone [Komagataella phaffii CBS 7435]
MSEPAQQPKAESKPKPCCVCKPEKEARDQCLLINGQDSGKCDDLISQYKVCMKGFGFDTN